MICRYFARVYEAVNLVYWYDTTRSIVIKIIVYQTVGVPFFRVLGYVLRILPFFFFWYIILGGDKFGIKTGP